MKSLFDAVTLGGVPSQNRSVRSVTFECPAKADDRFADDLVPLYSALAEGEVGVIVMGMVGVDGNSRALPSQVKAYSPVFAAELRRVAEAVHERGGRLVVQLNHCGVRASQVDGGGSPLGPSPFEFVPGNTARAMTPGEIAAMAEAFAAAAVACREAGADGVQMHAAHGYGLSQFLSPIFNKRTDEYGGAIDGRARAVFQVYEAIRRAVGAEYPVWTKINSEDRVAGGLTREESLWATRELFRRGIDAVEVTGGENAGPDGSFLPQVRSDADEGVFAQAAVDLAAEGLGTVISVCGYRTPRLIDGWLNKGGIEGIALCRPLILEPGLVKRWHQGDLRKPRCISCNKCLRPVDGLRCKVFDKPLAD